MVKFLKNKTIARHSSNLNFIDYIRVVKLFLLNIEREPLEKIWKPLLGVKKIIPLPTGRHALWLFLNQYNLPKGSEVLVVSYNFYVIVRIIIQMGLKPVFVDIDPDTLCMDPADLEKKITSKSKLVCVTHMFGNPADINRIKEICKKNKLLLFEDCAHAVGTYNKNDHAGTKGDGALFSFGIFKIINSLGGGMLVVPKNSIVNASELYGTRGLSSLIDNISRYLASMLIQPLFFAYIFHPGTEMIKGVFPKFYKLLDPSKDDPSYIFNPHTRSKFKPFMTYMISVQLKKLNAQIQRRAYIVQEIKKGLADVKEIKFLNEDKNGRTNYSYFGFYVPDHTKLHLFLLKKGILSSPNEYYDCSLLEQFAKYKSVNKHAQYASNHLIRIPNYPKLTEFEIKRIINATREFFNYQAV